MWFIISFFAKILFFIVGIINPIVVGIKYRNKHGWYIVTNEYWFVEARELDIYGNYAFRATWNWLFIKNVGYNFGVRGETISSALGKNKFAGTLSVVGWYMCCILDFIDNNHCLNSIREKNEVITYDEYKKRRNRR